MRARSLFATGVLVAAAAVSAAAQSACSRFRWEYRPGSELFVVYSEGRSTLPQPGVDALQNRGIVVKINRLFRF